MKNRTDSTHVQTDIMQKAMKSIKPPAFLKLDNAEKPFFDSITRSKAEWSDPDIIQAVHLARCFYQIETLQNEVSNEGYILDGAINPKHGMIETLIRRSLAISRLINIHASATQGRARDQVGKNTGHRKALDSLEDDDSLIAKPH